MSPLLLTSLQAQWRHHAIRIDQACFNGLWTENGYQREIDSPNSELLILGTTGPTSDSSSSDLSSLGLSSSDTDTVTELALLTGIGLGCVWFILEEAHITLLGILPTHRRQKFGLLLLLVLLEKAVQRGSKWATLEVGANNMAAQALYERVGFTSVGRRKRYYQETGEDALILWHRGLQDDLFRTELQSLKQNVCQQIVASGYSIHEHYPSVVSGDSVPQSPMP